MVRGSRINTAAMTFLWEEVQPHYGGVRNWASHLRILGGGLLIVAAVSNVQVKCLNPSLLVPDGGMGSISKVSLTEGLPSVSSAVACCHVGAPFTLVTLVGFFCDHS